MALTFCKLHPHFVAEVSPIDLRQVHDPETLAEIRAGMDEYGVLVFRNQAFTDDEHLAFAQRLDGELHTKTGISAFKKSRLGNEALADVSNLDENGGHVVLAISPIDKHAASQIQQNAPLSGSVIICGAGMLRINACCDVGCQ